MLTKYKLVNMSSKKSAWRKARREGKVGSALHNKVNRDVNAVVANQDTRKGKYIEEELKLTKKNSKNEMKTRKKIKGELLILQKKMPAYRDYHNSDSRYSPNDIMIGRIVALEWVLGLPSTKNYRASAIESIISEIQSFKDVEGKMKTRKEIEAKLSFLMDKLAPYKILITDEMTPYDKYKAKWIPYGELPIAHTMIGMIIALEWVLRSRYDDVMYSKKRGKNIPTAGKCNHFETYIRPRGW